MLTYNITYDADIRNWVVISKLDGVQVSKNMYPKEKPAFLALHGDMLKEGILLERSTYDKEYLPDLYKSIDALYTKHIITDKEANELKNLILIKAESYMIEKYGLGTTERREKIDESRILITIHNFGKRA